MRRGDQRVRFHVLPAGALALLTLGLLALSMAPATAAAQTGAGTVNVGASIRGSGTPMAPINFDVCQAAERGSCPVELTAIENLSLEAEVAFSTTESSLTPGATVEVSGSLTSLTAASLVTFNFTRGAASYVVAQNVSFSSARTPNPTNVSISSAALSGALSIPQTGLNLTLALAQSVSLTGRVQGRDFTGTGTLPLGGNGGSPASLAFRGGTGSAGLGLEPLASVQAWSMLLSASNATLSTRLGSTLGELNATSSGVIPVFTWYDVSVSSAFSSPLGSGWFLSGTRDAVSVVNDTHQIGQASRLELDGWSGTGNGSYTGPDTNFTLVVRSPMTESAGWQLQYLIVIPHSTGGIVYIPTSGVLSQPPVDLWLQAGSELPVQGVANYGYVQLGWRINGTFFSGSGYTYNVTGPANVEGVFAQSNTTSLASYLGPPITPFQVETTILGAVSLIVALVVAFVLLRRRRKGSDERSKP